MNTEQYRRFENQAAQEVLGWALNDFHPKVAIASSFGAEDVVVIDMAWKLNPEVRVFTLDTGRLHQETYDVMDVIRSRYNINIEAYAPDAAAVERMASNHGFNLFYISVDNRKLCCDIRKVKPLERALGSLDAWITGLRREQATTRSLTQKVEVDEAHGGILKINPIADWSAEQVWNYIRSNNIPYNKLHDQGYPSIGCEPCTRAVKPGEDPRTGRWWWEQGAYKECGLHIRGVHMEPSPKATSTTERQLKI